MKKFVFDIDGTICSEEKSQERVFAKPNQKTINLINYLYDQKHLIILYSARGWDQYRITENWLEVNKVNYSSLILGKPVYDYWIDDRCINIKDIDKLIVEF